jgi:hypothetical protein
MASIACVVGIIGILAVLLWHPGIVKLVKPMIAASKIEDA